MAFPCIIGREIAGEIVSMGPGLCSLALGDGITAAMVWAVYA